MPPLRVDVLQGKVEARLPLRTVLRVLSGRAGHCTPNHTGSPAAGAAQATMGAASKAMEESGHMTQEAVASEQRHGVEPRR